MTVKPTSALALSGRRSVPKQGGLILALAALVDYHTGLGPYSACGLDFGYGSPGAPQPPASLVTECGPASVAAGGGAGPAPGLVQAPSAVLTLRRLVPFQAANSTKQ